MLALTERKTTLTSLLRRATSLSCASLAGQQLLVVMLPLLQLLQDKPPREQPVLYVVESKLNVALDLATQVRTACSLGHVHTTCTVYELLFQRSTVP
jgi:hypothetical protein